MSSLSEIDPLSPLPI